MKKLNAISMKLSPWSLWSLSLSKGVAIGSIVFSLLLAACGDDSSDKTAGGTEEDAGVVAIEDKTISGVSQKGPFVNGSSVTVYGLDGETLAQTGNIYEGKIRSDMGDFSVKVVKLASPYALLKANGFYRNEVTGEKSNSQMTLYALTDLSDRDEVNVNLLTHLAYERSLYLAADSMSVASAKKQAEAEVFKSFEIEGDFDAAEDLNIFGENDQSAALLAISILMQGDLKEADFSERLDNYARDIEADGVWDDKKTATAIADWASEKSLSRKLTIIRANVKKWGQLFGVPPFEKYINNFWWQNYGLGTCDKNRQGEIKNNDNDLSAKNGVYFICDNDAWHVATNIERDTVAWGAGKFDGEIRAGQVNKNIYYIYETDKNAWRAATTLEEDTYDYTNNRDWATGKDGDARYGEVVKTNCYVFEDNVWRSSEIEDCSLGVHGCTKLRQGTIEQGKDKIWYICRDNWWEETPLNPDIQYGSMIDSRDGQPYKTVEIGNQIWMAQNLNYNFTDSFDRDGIFYGRGYTWEQAQNACDEGWHLPSREEFGELIDGKSEGHNWYKKFLTLESCLAYFDDKDDAVACTDDYGFSVFIANSIFWSSTEVSFDEACILVLGLADAGPGIVYDNREDVNYKYHNYGVRCVKDKE